MAPTQSKQLLVINSGSSSIKFAIYDFDSGLQKRIRGQVENIKTAPVAKLFDAQQKLIKETAFPVETDYADFYDRLLSAFEDNEFQFKIAAVGHRVAHGGPVHKEPALVSAELIAYLKTLIPFVPLHQPYNLSAIESIHQRYPQLPQVACFDTAFHATHPAVADRLGLPRHYSETGVRRYGFHGLSYHYIVRQFSEIHPELAQKRLIIAHLGSGASLCGVHEGKAIDSSMGFSSLDGLLMGTRCGSLDPGVILYLLQHEKLSAHEIENLLYRESGLLGVSGGLSNNMKVLLENKSIPAQEAVELFIYRLQRELGALVAVLGGLDALIFTGGIGEKAWQIRETLCTQLEWLDLALNKEANRRHQLEIHADSSRVKLYVIPTDEEKIIAEQSYRLLQDKR